MEVQFANNVTVIDMNNAFVDMQINSDNTFEKKLNLLFEKLKQNANKIENCSFEYKSDDNRSYLEHACVLYGLVQGDLKEVSTHGLFGKIIVHLGFADKYLSTENGFEKKPIDLAAIKKLVSQTRAPVATNVGGRTRRTLVDIVRELENHCQQYAHDTAEQCQVVAVKFKGFVGSVTVTVVDGDRIATKTPRANEHKERLLAEVAQVTKILFNGGHPNIVTYLSADPKELKIDYMYEPYVLQAVINAPVADPCARPLVFAVDVMRGLKFLHEVIGMIHADVKETNVVVTSSFRAKLIDFDTAVLDFSPGDKLKNKKHHYHHSGYADRTLMKNGEFSFELDLKMTSKMMNVALKNLAQTRDNKNEVATLETWANFCKTDDKSASDCLNMMLEAVGKMADDNDVALSEPQDAIEFPTKLVRVKSETTSTQSPLVANSEERAREWFNADKAQPGCRFGSFNARNLSVKDLERITALANQIKKENFHFVAVQEVRPTKNDVRSFVSGLKDILGTDYTVVATENLQGGADQPEYHVFISHPPVSIMSVAAMTDTSKLYNRRPAMCKLHVGKQRIAVCSVHLAPDSDTDDRKILSSELAVLPTVFDRLIETKQVSQSSALVILGDFNTSVNSGVVGLSALLEKGWFPAIPSSVASNKTQRKQYDNIFIKNMAPEQVIRSQMLVSNAAIDSDHHFASVDIAFQVGTLDPTTMLKPVNITSDAAPAVHEQTSAARQAKAAKAKTRRAKKAAK